VLVHSKNFLMGVFFFFMEEKKKAPNGKKKKKKRDFRDFDSFERFVSHKIT